MTGCVNVRRRGCRPARVKWVSAGDTGYTGFISSHPGIIFLRVAHVDKRRAGYKPDKPGIPSDIAQMRSEEQRPDG